MNDPHPPLHIALLEPEIPPNTGNIARLSAATHCRLHLVGRLGFRIDDKALRRAGVDYWSEVDLHQHRTLDALWEALPTSRFVYIETIGEQPYTKFAWQPGDCLVFGRETKGLPPELIHANPGRTVRIPMANPAIRSLNLANSVAIVLFEALRQLEDRCEGEGQEGG
ncbi:MAG: tRNA (cytidine(34)-2'-O)-methyltransferase [Blastocatellia bacterium]